MRLLVCALITMSDVPFCAGACIAIAIAAVPSAAQILTALAPRDLHARTSLPPSLGLHARVHGTRPLPLPSCRRQAANILTRVVDETLEGPAEEYIYTDDEYSAFVDEETFAARPDHIKEINYFKEPRNGRVISTQT